MSQSPRERRRARMIKVVGGLVAFMMVATLTLPMLGLF